MDEYKYYRYNLSRNQKINNNYNVENFNKTLMLKRIDKTKKHFYNACDLSSDKILLNNLKSNQNHPGKYNMNNNYIIAHQNDSINNNNFEVAGGIKAIYIV